MIAPGPEGLLVLTPCFNEEGAIGDVVSQIHRVLPGVPVLVIDDCSADGTVAVAKAAGAHVLTLPHHLGVGGAVQAGYKLAFELGFDYVIRVDGDGQHSAEDIPRVFDVLKKVEVPDGDRVTLFRRNRRTTRVHCGHSASWRSAPCSGRFSASGYTIRHRASLE